MRSARGRYRRAGRWLLISVAAALGALLLVVNALDLFPQEDNLSTLSLIRFGFSALTALVYLAVGSLVWLFARQRGVARWLFGFSLAMMITFANAYISMIMTNVVLYGIPRFNVLGFVCLIISGLVAWVLMHLRDIGTKIRRFRGGFTRLR